jgi:hypothetical protein
MEKSLRYPPILISTLVLSLLPAFALALTQAPAGDEEPSPSAKLRKSLMSSRWDSSYVDLAGTSRRAIIRLDGEKGRYDVLDEQGCVNLRGDLSELRYEIESGGVVVIRGTWSAGGTKGYLVFRISVGVPNRFMGNYGLDAAQGDRGNWNGRRFFTLDRKNPPLDPNFQDRRPPQDEDLGNP